MRALVLGHVQIMMVVIMIKMTNTTKTIYFYMALQFKMLHKPFFIYFSQSFVRQIFSEIIENL